MRKEQGTPDSSVPRAVGDSPAGRRSAQKQWLASACIVLLFLAAVFSLNGLGVSSRRPAGAGVSVSAPGIPVAVVADAAELYAAYRSRKVHGRILVHLGTYLQFVEIGGNDTYQGFFQFPIPAFSALRSYEEHISYLNVLWVGMQANLFREIISIVPPEVFQEKAGSIGPQDSNVVEVRQGAIIAHEWGSRRSILPRLERIPREPVLLNIDASLFSGPGVPEQVADILRSGLIVDLVTLNESRDNPDVPEENRRQLRRFAATLKRDTNDAERH